MKRKEKNKKMVCRLLCGAFLLLLSGCGKDLGDATDNFAVAEEVTIQSSIADEITEEELKEKQYYLSETTYDGSGDVPYSLYQIPFQKTDAYISNTELTEKVGERTIEEIRMLTEEFITLTLNKSAREYQVNSTAITNDIMTRCTKDMDIADAEYYQNTMDYIEMMSDAFVNTNTVMEAEFVTDNSLVYIDFGGTYVRGMLEFKILSTNDIETIKTILRVKNIEVGKKYRRMLEIEVLGSINTGLKIHRICHTIH